MYYLLGLWCYLDRIVFNMNFKIGDKVSYKGVNTFLGYVSHVDKGNLFLKDDPDVRIHFQGVITWTPASNLELFKDELQQEA